MSNKLFNEEKKQVEKEIQEREELLNDWQEKKARNFDIHRAFVKAVEL